MQNVVMVLDYAGYKKGQVVKISEVVDPKQDWVKTNKGVYIYRDYVRGIDGGVV